MSDADDFTLLGWCGLTGLLLALTLRERMDAVILVSATGGGSLEGPRKSGEMTRVAPK